MANILMEGFDWLPSGNVDVYLTAARYYLSLPESNGVQTRVRTAGVFGGYAYQISSFGNYAYWTMPYRDLQTPRRVYFGARCYVGSSQNFEKTIGFGFGDAINDARHVTIRLDQYGVIQVYRGSHTGTLLASSKLASYRQNAWFYLEGSVYIDNVNGEVEIRHNTQTVISVVNADTQNTPLDYTDSFWFGAFGGGGVSQLHDFRVDDIYVNDNTGSVNNGFLGNVRSLGEFMVADGSHIGMTIGGSSPAATNWQSVLNNSLDETTYVYTATNGVYDLYQPNPTLNSPLVHAVQVRASFRMTDATQRSTRLLLRVAGTTYDGGYEFFIDQTYSIYCDVWELNPSTTVGWTGAEVNGIEIGARVES